MALICLGLALSVARTGLVPDALPALRDLGTALVSGDSSAIIEAGFLLLLVTPAVGIALVTIRMVRQRSTLLAVASLFVLAILTLSIFLGMNR